MDPTKVAEWIGSLGGASIITFLITRADQRKRDSISRVDQEKRDLEITTNHRVIEALQMRRDAEERQAHLEVRMDAAEAKIDTLSRENIELITEIKMLQQQIADLNVQIAAYKKHEVEYRIEISMLQEKLAAKMGELKAAEERLESIREAHAKGTLSKSTFFQGRKGEQES